MPTPTPSPPVSTMPPPPTPPPESSHPSPPPLAPLAPTDIHANCVPQEIYQEFWSGYQATEKRLKSVLAENRLLRKQLQYYKDLSEAQKNGDLPKKTEDLIFKKRLLPFMTETRANVWVKNLKRPREWEAEDLNVAAEIASHTSRKGFEVVRGHLNVPCRRTIQKRFSWLTIVPGIIKQIGRFDRFEH